MKQYINHYFNNEKLSAMIGLVLSVVLIAVTFLLWRYPASPTPRGAAMALFSGAVFLFIATTTTIIHNNSRIRETNATVITSDRALQQIEVKRMEGVLKSAYIAGLALFSVSLMTGLIMMLVVAKPFLKGVALGLIVLGLLGVALELISMKNNRAYFEKIKSLNF